MPGEDALVDNSPTEYPEGMQSRASSLLFSMKANEVRDFLESGSAKEFSRGSLGSGYLNITGTLLNNYSPDAYVRIGGCWYDSISGTWQKDGYREITADGGFSVFISKYDFVPDMMLRGFIKNISGVGSVSGTIYFWDCAQ